MAAASSGHNQESNLSQGRGGGCMCDRDNYDDETQIKKIPNNPLQAVGEHEGDCRVGRAIAVRERGVDNGMRDHWW